MNARIRELEKQSYFTFKDENSLESLVFSKEKFAKLIVRECAELMEQQHTWISNVAASNVIRKHFGVDE